MIHVPHGSELPPNHVIFTSGFFQKLQIDKRRIEAVNDVLYQKFYNNVGHETHIQMVVPVDRMNHNQDTS